MRVGVYIDGFNLYFGAAGCAAEVPPAGVGST
jgi:hypothetical protein